jgi:Fe-S-cluster containining protein
MKLGSKKSGDKSVYLAFPDGVFHYVCRECVENCCYRSAEFDGSVGREIQRLVQIYPAMEIMATRRRGDVIAFTTPNGRCYFLNQDNRCEIEVRHGKEIKPSACRLFPFNSYNRLGKTLVVGLNFLCSLRLHVPAQPGQVEGTHASIEAHLRESPYIEGGYYDSLHQLHLHRGQKPEEILAEEIHFRDACSLALGKARFIETLRAASSEPDRLNSFVSWAAALLGLNLSLRPASRDHIDDLLLALASMLRLNLLSLPAEKRLRVLALSELALRLLLTLAGEHPVGPADAATPKGAYGVLGRLRPALWLLAISDEPVIAVKRATKNIPPFGDSEMTFAAFEILRAAENEEPLTRALERNLASLTVSNRVALLTDLAGLIGMKSVAKWRQRSAREAAAIDQ